jgi:hypothetical protein
MSTNGASTNVGSTATGVGDFTTLLLDINPNYTIGETPKPTRETRALPLNVVPRRLSNTRIALPLDVCHFARHNIDFEGPETADATFFSFDGNSIVSGRQRNPKTSLVISGK